MPLTKTLKTGATKGVAAAKESNRDQPSTRKKKTGKSKSPEKKKKGAKADGLATVAEAPEAAAPAVADVAAATAAAKRRARELKRLGDTLSAGRCATWWRRRGA